MVVKVYISGISGNKEVKKRQQRVLMILDSKNIKYEVVDITEPGKESEKEFMQSKSTSSGATVENTNPRHALPPQLFNDTEYCGDYDQFDLSNEIDQLEQFLKVEPPTDPFADAPEEKITTKSVEEFITNNIEQVESNGVASSRETSVEAEGKSNGAGEEDSDAVVNDDIVLDPAELKKDLSPSENLIQSEQSAAE